MHVNAVGYALLCIAAPLLWGLLVVWASNQVERKVVRQRAKHPNETTGSVEPIDYHI